MHGFIFITGRLRCQTESAPAEMRQQLGGIQVPLETIRDLLQQLVAGVAPERIIDGGQMFDIEYRHGRRAATADARLEDAHHAFAEQATFGKPGELIEIG